MRVLILGGTSFIGRAITTRLRDQGDDVAVVHRGRTEPPALDAVTHLHVERHQLESQREAIERFIPDAVVDSYALTRRDAETAVAVLPDVPTVVLSSQDVYAAFGAFTARSVHSPVPLTESAPLRTERRPYADGPPPGVPRDYEKLDVEEIWSDRGATILRLPMVYGPHDPQCREGFVLRRLAAGRRRIPIGAGNLLWSRCYVDDVAAAVVKILETPRSRGTVLNLAEPATPTIAQWMQQIAEAAGSPVELVPVPDAHLPADLQVTATHPQHILVDASRAIDVLGWRPESAERRVGQSVRWHLAAKTYGTWRDDDDAQDEAALRGIDRAR